MKRRPLLLGLLATPLAWLRGARGAEPSRIPDENHKWEHDEFKLVNQWRGRILLAGKELAPPRCACGEHELPEGDDFFIRYDPPPGGTHTPTGCHDGYVGFWKLEEEYRAHCSTWNTGA